MKQDRPEKKADRRRGQRKGATSKNVKNRQKVSKIFSTLFDIFRAVQKKSKIVKKCERYIFDIFRRFPQRHQLSGPFLGGSDERKQTLKLLG